MGEIKEKADRARKIRIDDRILAAIAIVVILIIAAAAFTLPGAGKTVSEYRKARAENKTAAAGLAVAEAENEEKTRELAELKEMKTSIPRLQEEVFKLASDLEKDIAEGRSDRKICYITLDDGPYKRGKKFLEIFRKYDVKATFFLTTANGNKLPDQGDLTAASMYPEYLKFGHTIGNHTYSHDYGTGGIYRNVGAFMSAVEKQEKFTEKATDGYRPDIVRFPGGTSMAGANAGKIQKELSKNGYGWIDWTVDSGDSRGKDNVTPESVFNEIKKAAGKQDIMVILFHEWSGNTLEAMPKIIEYLDNQVYIFLPIFHESIMVEK